MDKTRLSILAVVVVAVAGAIGLSRCSQDTKETAAAEQAALGFKKRDVMYPRNPAAQQRVKRRRQNGPLDTQRPQASKDSLDGLHRAMGGEDSKGAMFVELNAVRYSPLAEKILKCGGKGIDADLQRLKNELGIDPLEDVDRLAVQDGLVAASGFFEQLKIPEGAVESTYGDGAKLYDLQNSEVGNGAIAVMGDGLVMMGTPEELKAAVDRVEGRSPSTKAVPPGYDNAELYGRIDKLTIGALLQQSNDPLARRFSELVKQGLVRVNIDEEVALSVDVEADDAASGEDLAKAVAGAFAGLRKKAADDGEAELAYLLETAQVRPRKDGRFEIDVAVPGAFILNKMGCDAEGVPDPTIPLPVPRGQGTPGAPVGLPEANEGALSTEEPTLRPPAPTPLPGSSGAPRGFPTVIDDGT